MFKASDLLFLRLSNKPKGRPALRRVLSCQHGSAGAKRPRLGSPTQGGHRLPQRGVGARWRVRGIESGKKAARPELARAVDTARKHKARLVIAKLDRLSRNLAFVATLMETGVEFISIW